MDTLAIIGNWNIAKGRFKQRFARFTNNKFGFEEGMKDELTGRIQKNTVRNRKRFKADEERCSETTL
jgi:uncharacterized protein YjbJ (UPF0337 family)